MKEASINMRPVTLMALVSSLLLLTFLILVAPRAAHAANAGNTVVRNIVSVAYNDAAGTAQTAVTAYVDITVTTVAATPTVLSFSPTSGSTDGTSDTQDFTVRIRTNSNGPSAISFGTADGTFTNIAAGTAPSVPANIFLGATLIDPSDAKIGAAQSVNNAASITFAVPNDGGVPTDAAATGGATGDAVINGLRSGDTVYLYNGTNTYYGPFTVGTVVDPAVAASATAVSPGSVPLTNSSGGTLSFTPALGWEIVEAKDVTVTVTQGVVTDPTAAASWVTTVSATMAGASAGTNTVTTNALAGRLTVAKEFSTDGGNTFTTTPAAVAPGGTSVITYRITVTNTGTGGVSNVVLTDAQPAYTTYVGGSARYATAGGTTYGAATVLTDAAGGDSYGSYDFTAGTATYSIGTMASGAVVQFFFQVTVN